MANLLGCNTINTDPDCVKGLYPKEVYSRVIRKYERYAGLIGALEFSHTTEITPDEALEIGKMARNAGFLTWSIHSEHLNIGDTLEVYLKIQKNAAEVCAALGCQVMVCHLPNLRPYDDFERDLEVVGKVADLTHSCGIKLAVENTSYVTDGNPFNTDMDLVLQVVEALNRSDVGVNLDTGHAFLGQTQLDPEILEEIISGKREQRIADMVRRLGKRLFTTHLQDNFGLHDDHQAPGLGYIDWKPVISAIQDIGYQGVLMMELTGPGASLARPVKQMQGFPLEKDIVFGANYLNWIQQNRKGDQDAET